MDAEVTQPGAERLTASFRPDVEMRALRSYLRHRSELLQHRALHARSVHMQKALQHMNLQLHHVLSDVTGVTGLKILRAIGAGGHHAPPRPGAAGGTRRGYLRPRRPRGTG